MEGMASVLNSAHPFIYALIALLGWFIVRTLRQIDVNQKELWGHMDAHEKRLSTLEGAHNAIMQGGHKG